MVSGVCDIVSSLRTPSAWIARNFPGVTIATRGLVRPDRPMDLRDLITAEASDFTERLATALTGEVEEAARRAQDEAEAAVNKIRAELQQARAALDKARAESEQA